jgi:uncharacterized linocin/CFP29 family protein
MDDLHRELAPISSKAWEAIDREAKRALELLLAARKLVDFSGPLGWEQSAVGLGSTEALAGPVPGVEMARRRVLPLVELRAAFEIGRAVLEDIGRGDRGADLGPVLEAARRIAHAEDTLIFEGHSAVGFPGIVASSPHRPIALPRAEEAILGAVSEAIEVLREAGVGGPYAIALGPRTYSEWSRALLRTGTPLLDVLRRLLGGQVVRAPGLEGAVLASVRGGDYELAVGRDLSIGYAGHDERSVRFYLVESLAFRVFSPEAAVALREAA